MENITLDSYGKVNLSLDVLGKRDDGYHTVDMILQLITLHDKVGISWEDLSDEPAGDAIADGSGSPEETGGREGGQIVISLSTDSPDLPADSSNLAFRAAQAMADTYGAGRTGRVNIFIEKNIPIAAGLAGGSSNAAAVILGLAKLWELTEPLEALFKIGASLGADIPFCIAGLARWNTCLGEQYNDDPMAASCMRGEGTGTDLTPVNSLLDTGILLAKPDIGLSTGQIYTALDEMDVPRHPDIPGLIEILEDPEMSSGSRIDLLEKNMVNVLENVVFASYPIVVYTRNNLEQESGNRNIFMSGSGPTLFAFADADDRAALEESLAAKGIQNIFWAETTFAVETPQEESRPQYAGSI
ncbi:MAG: hypothetical protein IJF96_06340 [Firmicutes bacterium]|nr:hypothetical protein [Bacillota bacterium]